MNRFTRASELTLLATRGRHWTHCCYPQRMGPRVTAKRDLNPVARTLPADLADVALIDAATCAAVGAMSVSWWHDEVRAGRAPAPVIRKIRCTRWLMADVRAFWTKCAEQAAADTEAAAGVTARATKASVAARVKRAAAAVAAAT